MPGKSRRSLYGTIDSARPADATGIAGARVTIVADDGYRYHYFHLNNDTPGTDDGEAEHHWTLPPALTTGQRVSAGQIIGYLGDSGNSEHSVAHLHFEIRDPAGTPVPSYPLLVEAAARETCSVGLGPWVVPLTSSAATTPVSTRSENLAENSPPIAQPKRVEHATIRAGSLSGEWSIDSEGRVTAWGAAALVAVLFHPDGAAAAMRHPAPLPGGAMRPRCLIVALCLTFTGCATTAQRDAAAEARGYKRGYRQAVKEQYWIIQNQQRAAPPALNNPPPAP